MIHNSSVIEKKAKIGKDVKIGPFCYVGADVQLEEGVELASNIHIEGNTFIGKKTKIFPFACIGTQPQDLKFKGEKNKLEIDQNRLSNLLRLKEGVKYLLTRLNESLDEYT